MQISRTGDLIIAWSPDLDSSPHAADADAVAASRHPAALITGRMLARTLIAELTGLDATAVTLESPCPDCSLPHGRIRATGAASRARVSVSHAGGTTLAVAALDHEVGIDAEPAGASAGRLAAIDEVAGPSTDPLRHWTQIEAVLKADGRGLRIDPRDVRMEGASATLGARRYELAMIDVEGLVVSVARADEADRVRRARKASR